MKNKDTFHIILFILFVFIMFVLRPLVTRFLQENDTPVPHQIESGSFVKAVKWSYVSDHSFFAVTDTSTLLIVLLSDFTVVALDKQSGQEIWKYELPFLATVTSGMLFYDLSATEEYVALAIDNEIFLLDAKNGQEVKNVRLPSEQEITKIQFFPDTLLISGEIAMSHGEKFFSMFDFAGNVKWEKNSGYGEYDLLARCPAKILDEICMVRKNLFLIWDIQGTDPKIIKQSPMLFPPDYQTYEEIGNQFHLKDNSLLTLLKKYKRLRVTELENYNKNDILLPCTFNYPVNLLNSPNDKIIYISCDEKILEVDIQAKEYKIGGQISEPIIEAEVITNGNFVLLTNKAKIMIINSTGEVLGDLQTAPNTVDTTVVNQIFVDEKLAYIILDGSTIIAIDLFTP